nr:7034_t:CDS:2 [Entrophospora candida]CAG8618589.1 14947_t:CDS:2 [Entrophospora candida]
MFSNKPSTETITKILSNPSSFLSHKVNNNNKLSILTNSVIRHFSVKFRRWEWLWWKAWVIRFIVFGITGSTTVRVVRPIVNDIFGIDGSFIEGPWSFRLAYLFTTLPLYSVILLCLGTIFRQNAYFKKIVFRMYGRFIPASLMTRIYFAMQDFNKKNHF